LGEDYATRMTDYPDWQNAPTAMSGNLFADSTATLPAGTYDTAVIPVTSFSSLSVAIVPTTGAGQLIVSHWVDAAGTIAADADLWRFRPGSPLVVRTPLRAAFVKLTVVVTSAADLTASFWATALASSSDRVSYPVPGQQAGTDHGTLAPGALDQWRMPALVAGPAMLAYSPADASGMLFVEVVATDELDNQLYHLLYAVNPISPLMQPLILPGDIILVQVFNVDGAASHDYAVSLACVPS